MCAPPPPARSRPNGWRGRDARSAGVLGAGVQAKLQLEALRLVRDVDRALVWARDAAKAQAFAETTGAKLGLEIAVASSPEDLVRRSEIVVTTTPSTIAPDPGRLAAARAAHHRHGLRCRAQERAGAGRIAGARYVCDRQSQCAVLGELHHAIAAGAVAADARFPELGQVIAGQEPGRTSDRQITVCDLTGTGAQDTAIATLAAERARARGAGTAFQT